MSLSQEISKSRVRYVIAQTNLGTNLVAWGRPVDAVLREAGYEDPLEFWADFLSETMTVATFVRTLDEAHGGGPQRWSEEQSRSVMPLRASIAGALPDTETRLRAREAARWFMAGGLRKPLLPEGLRTFLEPAPNADLGRERTAMPGRPSSAHLIIPQLELRATAGTMEKTCTGEGAALSAWHAQEHPSQPRVRPKSVENMIRPRYRELKPTK